MQCNYKTDDTKHTCSLHTEYNNTTMTKKQAVVHSIMVPDVRFIT